MFIIVYFFIFLVSLYISFILLEERSFYVFCLKNYRMITASAIIYLFPKIVCLSEISLLLDIGFCITIITDMIEYSVFSIIPITIIIYSFLICLYHQYYAILLYKMVNIIILYIVFLLLNKLIRGIFNKDALGSGDLYFYFIFVWYFDLYFLFLSFFVASLFGLIFILFYKLIFFKKPLKKIIPFIPCLYLSISVLQVESVFNNISSFFLLI